MKLLKMQFVLPPRTENLELYKVVAYSKRKDKAVEYEVLFKDCPDPI